VFERFTEQARQVVVFAQEESRSLGHRQIGTEHLLLALLHDADETPARVLTGCGVTLESARARVLEIVGRGDERPSGQIPFTPQGKRVMERALRESLSHGHHQIATGHLLLALLREDEGVATVVLADLGADRGTLRSLVLRDLGPAVPVQWAQATLMWRAEGLELRVPQRLDHGAMAALATDPAWSAPPLAGLEREIWRGWLAVRSPTLLDDVDPRELRAAIDAALERASGEAAGDGRQRLEEFLGAFREER
jgi:Clp amino terminal domain, pathogenicity island component